MKKLISLLTVLALCLSCMTVVVFADEAPAADVNVYVSICNAGQLEVAYETVSVTDLDSDGAITIADALAAAHNVFYEGGAEAGFAAENTEYGLSLTKLWGVENGGSYGYYVNNASAWSLGDAVAEGDYVYAYSYQDLETWSDAYTYFDAETAVAGLDAPLTMTLSKVGFDENWAPVALPVEGAVVYVDGEATTAVTDAEGKVQVSFTALGDHTVTVKSEAEVITCAVCKVKTITFSDAAGLEDLEAVEAVIASGLMTGTDKGFEPQQSINRAQLVTILYRMAGSPEVSTESVFTDVYSGLWCEKAVMWAYEKGLVLGYGDGTFGYKDVLTVQQILLIASRYAEMAGQEVDVLAGATEFLGEAEQKAPVTRGDLAQLLGRAMISK